MTTPEGEGAQGGAEGTQSGAGESTTGNGSEGTTTGEGTQGGATTTPSEADSLKAELAKQRERTQAADKRAAQIEEQLKQLRDKDMPAQEKLQRDFEEATKQVTALRETNSRLALENAFLSDNTYKWKNPKRALQLIDLSQVEIGDDGSVSGLKDALKALATSDPYMLETEATEIKPPTTTPANNGSGGGGKPDKAALSRRFPGMNTRVRRSG